MSPCTLFGGTAAVDNVIFGNLDEGMNEWNEGMNEKLIVFIISLFSRALFLTAIRYSGASAYSNFKYRLFAVWEYMPDVLESVEYHTL